MSLTTAYQGDRFLDVHFTRPRTSVNMLITQLTVLISGNHRDLMGTPATQPDSWAPLSFS